MMPLLTSGWSTGDNPAWAAVGLEWLVRGRKGSDVCFHTLSPRCWMQHPPKISLCLSPEPCRLGWDFTAPECGCAAGLPARRVMLFAGSQLGFGIRQLCSRWRAKLPDEGEPGGKAKHPKGCCTEYYF